MNLMVKIASLTEPSLDPNDCCLIIELELLFGYPLLLRVHTHCNAHTVHSAHSVHNAHSRHTH